MDYLRFAGSEIKSKRILVPSASYFTTIVVLVETERLILRGLKLDDAPTVFNNWASVKEVAKFMRWDAHANVEVTKKWMQECEEGINDKSRYDWGRKSVV